MIKKLPLILLLFLSLQALSQHAWFGIGREVPGAGFMQDLTSRIIFPPSLVASNTSATGAGPGCLPTN